jgi:hypothetical protein
MASEMNQAISVAMDVTKYKAMSGLKIHKHSIQPENRVSIAMTKGNTSDLYFALHARPNSFINGMNTHLSYNYSYVGTTPLAAAFVENCNGSPNFIRTLETLAGSTSLELINNYNVLAATLDDISSAERGKTLGSILQDKSTTAIKRGNARSVIAAAAEGFSPRRVCIPLISSVVGVNSEVYLPVGRDIGLRLRLTMEDPAIALHVSGVTTGITNLGYELTDITLEVEYIEVPPSIYNTLANEAEGVFKISGVGISNFTNNVSAGANSQSLLIPARYSSVRNFLTVNRLQTVVNNEYKNSLGGRTRDNITSYSYRISGTPYPNLPVVCDGTTSAEALTEVIKSFHGHGDLSMNVCFDRTDFVRNGEDGAFMIGIDFEEAGFSAQQMSGINTTSGNVFLELGYSSASSASVFDSYCFYDQIIEINSQTGEVSISR